MGFIHFPSENPSSIEEYFIDLWCGILGTLGEILRSYAP